jgi:hypothetical protein
MVISYYYSVIQITTQAVGLLFSKFRFIFHFEIKRFLLKLIKNLLKFKLDALNLYILKIIMINMITF